MDTYVVVSHGIVKYSHFGCELMLGNELCGFLSLHGVCEAHTEQVASCCDTVYCCSGRCEQESALCRLSAYCDTGCGGYGTTEHLHPVVQKIVVSVDSFLRISHIIAGVQDLDLISVESAVRVNILCSKYGCVIYVGTVLCVVTGHRSDNADLEGFLFFCKNSCGYHCRCSHGNCGSHAECFFPVSHNNSPP